MHIQQPKERAGQFLQAKFYRVTGHDREVHRNGGTLQLQEAIVNEKPWTAPDPVATEVRVVEGLEKDAIALARDRTSLASFRVKLALDRTTLAWIRTTLTMATFGFGLVAFFRALREAHPQSAEVVRMHEGAIEMGMALLLLGIVATGLPGASHWYALRRLRRGETPVLTH